MIAIALTLSMPIWTDPRLSEAAALAFGLKEFGGREYAWIAADHSGPCVKFLVQYWSEEDKPLSPDRTDLRRYREIYAQELSARGVPASATTRGSRGLGFGEARQAYKERRRLFDEKSS